MLFNRIKGRFKSIHIIFFCLLILLIPALSNESQWVNPKIAVNDPMTARLQQGRTELTALEKQEISRYGFTGLELITYVDMNTRPDKSWDRFERVVVVTAGGRLKTFEWLWKELYTYKNPAAVLTCDGIGPGSVMKKIKGIYMTPPQRKYRGFLFYIYLTSPDKHLKDKEGWAWVHALRRYRRSPTTPKDDTWLGSVLRYDDFLLRKPWEEKYRILGEDVYDGRECLVVEGINTLNPDYYLSKRITWVEKKHFLDLHEEQFDKKGRCTLIINKLWTQIKPWNYWVRAEWNCMDPLTGRRIVRLCYDWKFDRGFTDGDFLPATMAKENFWRQPETSLQPVRSVDDLPPEPAARFELWKKQRFFRKHGDQK